MIFSVIDIETTGGSAKSSKIIEIAIYKTDGESILDEYHSLVNPDAPIPSFITSLTGIDDDMVKDAPLFGEIADEVHEFTSDSIFVAHNVNFDYSFVKEAFADEGMVFDRKKLCTVRLSRKIVPGLPSYSLGNLCKSMLISIDYRHRAHGDAKATTELLHLLIQKDENGFVDRSLKRNSREATLPPNLPKSEVEELPLSPGVYYFHDRHGKVIYVGKAKRLKSRVIGHFTDGSGKRKQKFINEIFHVSFEETGNELVALLHESNEIKRLWPKFNRIQKYPANNFGLYQYEDNSGYIHLQINRVARGVIPILQYKNLSEARSALIKAVADYELCPKLCGLQTSNSHCFDYTLGKCKGACINLEDVSTYNDKVLSAVEVLKDRESTYAVVGDGRDHSEKSIVLVEDGRYLGFGFCSYDMNLHTLEEFKDVIDPCKDDQDIRHILSACLKKPGKNQIITF